MGYQGTVAGNGGAGVVILSWTQVIIQAFNMPMLGM